ncbi:MAG: emp24/gp25L/p24 family protein [Candidatus Bathyarchaeota archaeon]
MKKYFPIFLLIILLLSVEIITAEEMELISVSAGGRSTFAINLEVGQKCWGTISIEGESENDIDFYIQNPEGITIIELGRVSQGDIFEFKAQEAGSYVLNFDNYFSSIGSKVITLTYKLSLTPIVGIDPVLFLTIIFAVIIIIVLLLFYRRSKKLGLNNK